MSDPGPTRRLAVCADDYGCSPAVSRGIVQLALRGRLTAVSCLTGGEHWPACAPWLASLPAGVERGLHFNLTEGRPLSPALRRLWPRLPSLPRLMLMAALRRLPLAALATEWQAQWHGFVDATGAVPDFVDGHQHVHQLPGVREIVLAAVAAQPRPPAVRNTGCLPGPGDGFKRIVIERTGGRALQQALRRAGLRHNAVLIGAYGFDTDDYGARLRGWLPQVGMQGALLFCHPGDPDAPGEAGDPIAAARRIEARYLGSDRFPADLREAGITLGPVWQRRSSGG